MTTILAIPAGNSSIGVVGWVVGLVVVVVVGLLLLARIKRREESSDQNPDPKERKQS